ncbi:cell envelope integrity protein CreD [Desulfovibrio sp. OttesenSCG-928-G11]|nr:cell envelope integrity protein CreD [Desulfovibrio sp. OttesenSCG-928-G11]
MFYSKIMFAIVCLIALAGCGLAAYGLLTLIRKLLARGRKSGALERDGEGREANALPAAGPPLTQAGGGREANALPAAGPPLTQDGGGMDKLFYRSLFIAGLALALLVPLGFVYEIVIERSDLRRQAVNDIAGLWGQAQTINGPALIIPYVLEYDYKESVENADGKIVTEIRKGRRWEHRLFLPANLLFESKLDPQVRHRGIYEYVVYTSSVEVSGTFRLPEPAAFGENVVRIAWESAWLALGITDLRAITGVSTLSWNGQDCAPYNPGTGLGDLLGPGFQGPVALDAADAGTERAFALSLTLNGSGGMFFTPVGETTRIRLSGDWPHPKFRGSLLPVTRSISDSDFSAEWVVPHLSRTYPQSGIVSEEDYKPGDITGFTAGVDLFEVVSLYTQVNRAVKYGLLFIGLTYTALLAFELVRRKRLHLMQYALVGLAMTVFYLVLLSLAEHTSFIAAFVAASAVCILMNSLYVAAAVRSGRQGLVVGAMLTALYLLLYTLLQMEEYALIIGTGMVLTVLGILMWLTRHLPDHKTDADRNGKGRLKAA